MRRLPGAGLIAAAAFSFILAVAPASAAPPKHSAQHQHPPVPTTIDPAAHGGIHHPKALRAVGPTVIGTTTWVILRCKYQGDWDSSAKPQSTTTKLDTMFDQPSGLADFWQRLSYAEVSINHVVAGTESEWRTMPHTNAEYGYGSGSGQSLYYPTVNESMLWDDCVGQWDADVTFSASNYYVVLLDQRLNNAHAGLGGGWTLNRDGVTNVSGLMLGDFQTDESAWAHEMGHAFGLAHAESQDSAPLNIYDHPYDIMANTWGSGLSAESCYKIGLGWDDAISDPRYVRSRVTGCLPGQTQAWNKAVMLGWIPKNRQYVNPGGTHTINLEELALPKSATNPLYARLSVGYQDYYTVESRLKTGIAAAPDFTSGFDENFPARKDGTIVTKYLPNDPRGPVGCVVINHVYTSGATHLVLMGTDDDHNGQWGDPGTCFTPGETWTDPTGKVKVQVNAMAASSFNVTLTSPAAPSGRFVPLPRTRILKTGSALGGHPSLLGAGQTMSLKVLGVGGVPTTGVQAVILNLHALNPTDTSAITVWPAGASRPASPDLMTRSADAGDALITVAPGTQGNVRIFNSQGTTGLAVDVVGYYGRSFDGLKYQPIYPFRIALTTVAAGDSQAFLAEGYAPAPLTPNSLVVLEVTVQNSSQAGSLRLYGDGAAPPAHPDFSYPAKRLVTRPVIVAPSPGGLVRIKNGGTAPLPVSIELVGYFAPTAPDVFHPLPRTHLRDLSLTGGTPKALDPTGVAGVPNSGVDAIVGTATITKPSAPGYLTFRPKGVTPPSFCCGFDVAYSGRVVNTVMPMVGPTGLATLLSTADAAVGLDVVGWFGPP